MNDDNVRPISIKTRITNLESIGVEPEEPLRVDSKDGIHHLSIDVTSIDNLGVVQLYDGYDQPLTDKAPTVNALKKAFENSSGGGGNGVPPDRRVDTISPLQGGGTLITDISLHVLAATLEDTGVVQLSNDPDNDSDELAATISAVNKVKDSIPSLDGTVGTDRSINTTLPITGGGNLENDLTLEINSSTVDTAGIVQLYDGTDSDATNLAATANSVKLVQDNVDDSIKGLVSEELKITTVSPLKGGGDLTQNRAISIDDATDETKGAVQLYAEVDKDDDTLAATAGAVKKAYDAAINGDGNDSVPPDRTVATEYPLVGGGDLSSDLTLSVEEATLDDPGVVQLYDGYDTDDTSMAPTVAALKEVYESIPEDGGGALDPNPTVKSLTIEDSDGGHKAVIAFNDVGDLIITYNGHTLKLIDIHGDLISSGDIGATDRD